MVNLLDDIRKALDAKAYYLALMGALSLPGVCAAMEHIDGIAKPDRYERWFNTRLGQKYRDDFTGKQCYQFRCNMLQEKSITHQPLASDRIVFMIPEFRSNVDGTLRANRVIYLDLEIFCGDMTNAVREWLKAVKWTEPFETHMAGIVRVHPSGIPGAFELSPMLA
jgi:hypothetical protein